MDCIHAALQFNQLCPKGSTVEIVLKSGERLSARTERPAFVGGGLALVELQGRPGPFQVELVRPTSETRRDCPTQAERS